MLLIDLNYLLFVTKIQHKVPNHRCLFFNWLDLVICLIAYASLTQPGTPCKSDVSLFMAFAKGTFAEVHCKSVVSDTDLPKEHFPKKPTLNWKI